MNGAYAPDATTSRSQDGRGVVPAPTRTVIVPPKPSSLPEELSQLEYSSRAIVSARDGGRLLRAWGPPEEPWVLAVEPSGDRWNVEAWGPGPREARAAVRALFSLDHPLFDFYRQVRREPVLRGTERSFRGLRIPRDANLYEALVHSVVGQQLSVAAANSLKRRLFDRLDGTVEVEGIRVPWTPPPSRLIDFGAERLHGTGLSRAKSRSLVALARWAGTAAAEAPRLQREPLDAARASLEELPGVGAWTAENALLRGTGRTDVFVAGDLGVRVALERFGGILRTAPEPEARAWSDRNYPRWGSYATLYLWRKLVAQSAASAQG